MSALVTSLMAIVATVGVSILYALIVLVIGLKLIKFICKKLMNSRFFDKVDPSLRSFLNDALRIVLYVLLIMMLVSILGLETSGIITMLASCGVAVGLAMQGSLSNVAGGVMLLIFRPFRVGDFVDVAGCTGTVMEINVFSTVLNTLDNRRVIIPNGSITGATVTNYSYEGKRRVDLTFDADYDADIEKVKQVITEVAESHPKVLKGADAPAPIFVRMSAQKDNALEYTIRAWCLNADYWDVYFDLMEGMKKAFDENGIDIPFPQVVVHQGGDRP